MDVYELTVPQLQRTLRNLSRWLDHARKHEKADALLSARLAPDQFTLTRQVQTSADNAKMLVSRLAGKQWPSHPDTETTYDELQARLVSVIDYLGTFSRADFDGVAERKIRLPWMAESQYMHAPEYLVEFGLPNFYFHVVTAYSILRNQGLPLGKIEYIGQISIRA